MDKRVKMITISPFRDIENKGDIRRAGEEIEVNDDRARKLYGMGLAVVMRINKLNKQINERISKAESAKRGK